MDHTPGSVMSSLVKLLLLLKPLLCRSGEGGFEADHCVSIVSALWVNACLRYDEGASELFLECFGRKGEGIENFDLEDA